MIFLSPVPLSFYLSKLKEFFPPSCYSRLFSPSEIRIQSKGVNYKNGSRIYLTWENEYIFRHESRQSQKGRNTPLRESKKEGFTQGESKQEKATGEELPDEAHLCGGGGSICRYQLNKPTEYSVSRVYCPWVFLGEFHGISRRNSVNTCSSWGLFLCPRGGSGASWVSGYVGFICKEVESECNTGDRNCGKFSNSFVSFIAPCLVPLITAEFSFCSSLLSLSLMVPDLLCISNLSPLECELYETGALLVFFHHTYPKPFTVADML